MKMITRLFLLAFCSLFLFGCAGVIQNRDREYLSAKSVPPLRIPPGISSNAFHTTYPVPDHAYPQNAANVSLVPPGLTLKS